MLTGDFMIIHYDKEKLISALSDFSNATGVNINLVDKDGNTQILWHDYKNYFTIPPYCRFIHSVPGGSKNCTLSDFSLIEKCRSSLKAEHHICHAGLLDIAVPITLDDSVLGFIILGQMRTERDFEKVYPLISGSGFDKEELKKNYEALPPYDENRINGIINVAVMLTKYILTENMVKAKGEKNIDLLTEFINKNITLPLSPDFISKGTFLSKTTLYKLSNTHYGVPLSEYINMKKVDASLKTLLTSDLSIEEIALKFGFATSSYYGKVFKKFKGMSPSAYKKKHLL